MVMHVVRLQAQCGAERLHKKRNYVCAQLIGLVLSWTKQRSLIRDRISTPFGDYF